MTRDTGVGFIRSYPLGNEDEETTYSEPVTLDQILTGMLQRITRIENHLGLNKEEEDGSQDDHRE